MWQEINHPKSETGRRCACIQKKAAKFGISNAAGTAFACTSVPTAVKRKDNFFNTNFDLLKPMRSRPLVNQGLALNLAATKADFDATIGIHLTTAKEFMTMRDKRKVRRRG